MALFPATTRVIAALCTAAVLSGCSGGVNNAQNAGSVGPPPAPRAPNILFILADDFGAEASSLYPSLAGASGQVATPSLEQLASRGIVFDNVWTSPVCSPTRATVVSGQYGHRTGVTNVGDILDAPTTTSIFEYVAQSSPERYAMAAFGKWHLGPTAQHVRASGVPTFRGFVGGGITNYFDWS